MSDEAERMQILDMIERGQITPDQGVKLLQALESEDQDEGDFLDESESVPEAAGVEAVPPAVETALPGIKAGFPAETAVFDTEQQEFLEPQPGGLPPEAARWRRFWMIPLWIGVGILALGGWLMYWVLQHSGLGFWFVISTLPFILGLVIVILSWQSQTAPWVHLRVTQAPGKSPPHVAFSFPIPIRPTLWFLNTFGDKIPRFQEVSLDKIILAVNQSANAEHPIYIQVDEGEKGEKVEIYIG